MSVSAFLEHRNVLDDSQLNIRSTNAVALLVCLLCPYPPFPHANLFLSSRYHNELFPHVYQPTDEDLIEISDILTYSIGGSYADPGFFIDDSLTWELQTSSQLNSIQWSALTSIP